MAVQTIPGDLLVRGHASFRSVTIPPSSLDDSHFRPDADLDPDKFHSIYHRPNGSQPNTSASDETRIVFEAMAGGEVVEFRAGSIGVAVGGATVTVDLKKGGASILSSVITLDSANVARVSEVATLTGGATLADGDVLEVVIDATAGGGTLPTGVFWSLLIQEEVEY